MGRAIEELLRRSRNIAVVGLSGKPWRTSHSVAGYMQAQGYRIIPVNPNETSVLGEKSYSTLEQIREPIDIVNVFRRSEHVADIVESAIRAGAKAIWTQLGVEDQAAAARARAAGLEVVMDRCILVEHQRLIG
jgi:predicted CoA-binding protein